MSSKPTPSPQAPLSLKSWLWRSYVRAALVPLLLIELTFLGLYWGTSRVVYDRSAEAVRSISTDALRDAALRESAVIARRLETIAALTRVYADETGRALATPAPDVTPDQKAAYAFSPDGAFYTTRDTGGSAVFFSGVVPIGPAEQDKVWRTLRLDPLMQSITAADPLITQLYLNTNDSLNRIYPYFDVLGIYPPKMDIPSYNFYYEADATHNPTRGVVWTDAYVDPAGSGWMVSSIAPVYSPDRLEAVVGVDVRIDTIVDQVLNIELDDGGYALLVSRDGTILALPPKAEADWGVSELLDHSYEEAILQDTFKPDSFNIYRRAELFAVADAMQSADTGQRTIDLGRPMIAAWSTIAGPEWKLIVMTSEEEVLSEATTLRAQLAVVSQIMLAILVLFYAVFFVVLWRRSAAMSTRVASPLAEIERNMVRISEGGDIPATHRYEVAELQTVADHLVTMGAKLAAASRAKANFLSAMSHELRTPLNAIMGFSELLGLSRGERLDDDRMKQVGAISSAGWHLLQLVEGVMDLSRIEQDEIRQSLSPLDPVPVAQRAAAALRPALAGRQIALTVDSPAQPLPQVRGDADILQRILTHLLSNAVKYNHDGGSVQVSFASTATEVGITVRDTGIGIPAALQGRLFTPFDRLGHENSNTLGTGIGLTICRRLAELTDCRISFASTEGQGSSFTLHIPRA